MSGLELLRILPRLKIDLPVIVITGSDIEDVRGEVEGSGAFALFEKPLADRRLLAAVERALARRRG
jgi:FixJ family two-component response regulator